MIAAIHARKSNDHRANDPGDMPMDQAFTPDLLICAEGHDHATHLVWVSEQQQGVYSRKRLPSFHCEKCQLVTNSGARKSNWRSVTLEQAIVEGSPLPCAVCLPKLAPAVNSLIRWLGQQHRGEK